MPTGLDIAATATYPGASGSEFEPVIDSSPEASWTSHFDDPATMAAPTGNGPVPVPNATPPTDNISVGQRMVSATAGNILTGLLGRSGASVAGSSERRCADYCSHPPRCGACASTVPVAGQQCLSIYLPYHSNPEEPAPEHWHHRVLSRGILGWRQCANVHDRSKWHCDWDTSPSTSGT